MAGDTSRANGRRSRGPVTAEGKRASSANARRHGLAAQPVGEGHGAGIAVLASALAGSFADDPAVAEAAAAFARAQAQVDRVRHQDVAAISMRTRIHEEEAALHAAQGERAAGMLAIEQAETLGSTADPRPHRKTAVLRMLLAHTRRRLLRDPGEAAQAARKARIEALADRAVHARYLRAALAARARARRDLAAALAAAKAGGTARDDQTDLVGGDRET